MRATLTMALQEQRAKRAEADKQREAALQERIAGKLKEIEVMQCVYYQNGLSLRKQACNYCDVWETCDKM